MTCNKKVVLCISMRERYFAHREMEDDGKVEGMMHSFLFDTKSKVEELIRF